LTRLRKPPSVGFIDRYGPVALIAGASEGIGAAFACELAAMGLDLVLVARRAAPLEALADELRAASGVRVQPFPCDLAEPAAAGAIAGACRGLQIGLLVYNAAASSVGRFLDIPIESHLRTVDVNARGPLLLAHAFGGAMVRRGRGGIVLMSSLTAFQGTPLVASYGATKAFNLVLAEGLWGELQERGVDVLACCAGSTLTPGYERATPPDAGVGLAPKPQRPEDVAREALDALGRGPLVITGRGNRFASFIMRRIFTRRAAVATLRREMRKRYG
jgi:short-subunit dehydrogenase